MARLCGKQRIYMENGLVNVAENIAIKIVKAGGKDE